MSPKAKGNILSDVIYPMLMIPAMAFIAVQVYEINAKNAVSAEKIAHNAAAITAINSVDNLNSEKIVILEKDVATNRQNIDYLKNEHFRQPRREPKLMPPNEALSGDRRKFHVEGKP
jgi:hypothetical protein